MRCATACEDKSSVNTANTTCSGYTIQVLNLGTDPVTCVRMSSYVSWSNSKYFYFVPSSDLDETVSYKIRVTTGVKDGSGNNMSSQFQTGSAFTVDKAD